MTQKSKPLSELSIKDKKEYVALRTELCALKKTIRKRSTDGIGFTNYFDEVNRAALVRHRMNHIIYDLSMCKCDTIKKLQII